MMNWQSISVSLFLYYVAIIRPIKGVDQCREDQFRCEDGSECIRATYRCDNDYDCGDRSDEEDCDHPIRDNFLLVSVARSNGSSSSRPQIYQIDVVTAHSKHFLASEPHTPAALAIDHRRKVLYYVDRSVEMIASVSIDQPSISMQTIFRDPTLAVDLDGIAIDTITQKLYYCDGGVAPKIAEIDLRHNDKIQRTIYSGSNLKPKGVVVDEANSELYWSDWGTNPGIFVIGLEQGATRKPIITRDIVMPNGLTIDFQTEVMYWIDANLDRIEMAKLDGRDRVTLLRASSNRHYYALTISPQFLYIADWTAGSVLRFDRQRNTTTSQMPVLAGLKTGIAFYRSTFNNTGRRRSDRINITTSLPMSTTRVTASISAISATQRSPTSVKMLTMTSSAFLNSNHIWSTKTKVWKDASKSPEAEKIVSTRGLRKEMVIVLVLIGVVILVLVVSIAIWSFAKKRRCHRQLVVEPVAYSNPIQTTRGTRQPDEEYLWVDDKTKGNSYEHLPEPDHYIKPLPRAEDDQRYLAMNNEYAGYDPQYSLIRSHNNNEFYDDTA